MAFWERMKKALVGEPQSEPERKPSATNTEEGEGEGAVNIWSGARPKASPQGDAGEYKKAVVVKGPRGWGGPLTIQPTKSRNLIYCVTGGGIHPVAKKIADVTGGRTFDGFKSKAEFDQLACVVINCGGTARVGVYPMKGVLTIDVTPTSPSGPLAKFITEKNFVSGVTENCVQKG